MRVRLSALSETPFVELGQLPSYIATLKRNGYKIEKKDRDYFIEASIEEIYEISELLDMQIIVGVEKDSKVPYAYFYDYWAE